MIGIVWVVLGLALVLGVALTTGCQLAGFREWLKYAVSLAEKELGSGTGQLKLRLVYELFLSKFPWLGKLVSFEVFSSYVDEALVWLNTQLESNTAVAGYVRGE